MALGGIWSSSVRCHTLVGTVRSWAEPTVADAAAATAESGTVLVSHTGHVLSRDRTFRFAAELTVAQVQEFFMCAGGAGSCSTITSVE